MSEQRTSGIIFKIFNNYTFLIGSILFFEFEVRDKFMYWLRIAYHTPKLLLFSYDCLIGYYHYHNFSDLMPLHYFRIISFLLIIFGFIILINLWFLCLRLIGKTNIRYVPFLNTLLIYIYLRFSPYILLISA